MEKILFNAMLTRIQKEIRSNKDNIMKLNEIDIKYFNIKIDVEKLVKIIESYKEKVLKNEKEKVFIYCNGNPYIVLNLIIIAIITNTNMKINIDDVMLGVNKYILQIINNILEDNKIKIKIEFSSKAKQDESVIFIDRINDFNILKNKYKNIKFIPYELIDVYCDSDEYEELFEKVYNYALNMNIDIDIFDEEEGIDSFFKYGKGRRKLILTKEESLCKNYIDKKIYINENPFKNENIIFENDIIKEILSY